MDRQQTVIQLDVTSSALTSGSSASTMKASSVSSRSTGGVHVPNNEFDVSPKVDSMSLEKWLCMSSSFWRAPRGYVVAVTSNGKSHLTPSFSL
jgi:hypothetical protein